MSTEKSNIAIGILSTVVVGLIIAIVVLLSCDPYDGTRLNYTLHDNEAGIENAADYGLRMAPDNVYDIIVEETDETFPDAQ